MAKCIVCYTAEDEPEKIVRTIDNMHLCLTAGDTTEDSDVLEVKKLCPHYKDGKFDYYMKTQLYAKEQ